MAKPALTTIIPVNMNTAVFGILGDTINANQMQAYAIGSQIELIRGLNVKIVRARAISAPANWVRSILIIHHLTIWIASFQMYRQRIELRYFFGIEVSTILLPR